MGVVSVGCCELLDMSGAVLVLAVTVVGDGVAVVVVNLVVGGGSVADACWC